MNIKRIVLSLLIILMTSTMVFGKKNRDNTLTRKEIKQGWVLLFDGKSFDGWRGYNMDRMPDNWTVADNSMRVGGDFEGVDNDIIYTKKFKNFHLKFYWKVDKNANSGIFYIGREQKNQPFYANAIEYQILDNESYSSNGAHRASASLYDMIAAEPQNANPVLKWNTGEIIVQNGNVVHIQNGVEVVKYSFKGEWAELFPKSKFKYYKHLANPGGDEHEGFIGFQGKDEGKPYVWFKNIKIKELK